MEEGDADVYPQAVNKDLANDSSQGVPVVSCKYFMAWKAI